MRLNRRSFLAGTAAAAWTAAVPACGATTTVIGGPAFGSYWRVSLDRGRDLAAIERRIKETIASLGSIFSPYDSRSELSAFNALDTTDWTPASPALCSVLQAALRIAAISSGSFDPTVGPIVSRYGFGPIQGASDVEFVQLAVQASAIRKEIGTITIDLCGIAKGFALDRMRATLDELGLRDFLIELGGEVISEGKHPAGRSWQVAIENSTIPNASLLDLVGLDGRAIATSGVTVNGYEIAGRRYSHIIDARRRAPVNGDVVSASVISRKAMQADGLATALVALRSDEAIALADRLDLDAAIYVRDGGAVKTVMTGRFADHLIG